MYPTITDFLEKIFGINIPLPVQTYGFFVALAFISATFILMLEIKRKTNEGLIPEVKRKYKMGEKPTFKDILFNLFQVTIFIP